MLSNFAKYIRNLFLVFLVIVHTQCEFYSSICKLSLLIDAEVRLIKGLNRYIEAQEKEDLSVPKEIKRLLRKAEDEQKLISADGQYPENPINSFHLQYRLQKDWGSVFNMIWCETCETTPASQDFNITFGIVEKKIGGWLTEKDIQGTAIGILRLSDVYQLNIANFFDGRIKESVTKPLSPMEIMSIALTADKHDMMYDAISWFTELHKRFANKSFKDENIKTSTIARKLAGAYNKVDMPWKSLEILEPYLESDANNKKIQRDVDFYKLRLNGIPKEKRNKTVRREKNMDPIYRNYQQLCRGSTKTSKEESKTRCFLSKTEIPYYYAKQEVVNNRPKVSLFHDVIYEEEMETLRNISAYKFQRSTVIGGGTDSDLTTGRISQTYWLTDFDHPLLVRLSRRIEIITGLETEFKNHLSNTESYQILNYGVGGMYEPHTDPLGWPLWGPPRPYDPDYNKGSGDRIATWMFYLNEVKYGGATIFNKIKTRVPVVKGGAAFWYNLKPNGDVDERTLHAGCPVLIGSKWVANKWIREGGQVFRRKCQMQNKKQR